VRCGGVQHIMGDVPQVDIRECETRTRRTGHPNFTSVESDCTQRGTKTARELGGKPGGTQEVLAAVLMIRTINVKV